MSTTDRKKKKARPPRDRLSFISFFLGFIALTVLVFGALLTRRSVDVTDPVFIFGSTGMIASMFMGAASFVIGFIALVISYGKGYAVLGMIFGAIPTVLMLMWMNAAGFFW